MPESISHIALVVKDPGKTAALFHELFSARVEERRDDDGYLETFVKLGGIWIVLVGAPAERVRTGDHIAFHATAVKLQQMGREFVRARSNRSLYFFTSVPTLFEQNQLVGAAELVRPLHGERKQLIERSFLEQGQAQNL